MSRILLRGGLVADGIGSTTRLADVLIDGPLIASIDQRAPVPVDAPAPSGPAVPAGCEVIDLAPGSVVCPGFIDAHVHAEGQLLADGRVEGALAQGVTTLVVGQDGQSWIGASAATARYLSRYFAPVNGALEPARDLGVAGYAAEVSGRLTQNVAVLASQGTIRHNIAGMKPGPLDPAERAAARRQLEDALADGAVGLSSGLDYLPSRLGSVAEVADLARPLAAADRPYVSHLRGYGSDVRAGLDELTAVGHQAGVRVHASHLWGAPADIEAAFGSAEAAGVAITCDMYPYRKSSTTVAALLLPAELQAAGLEHTLAALADPASRAELLAGPKLAGDYLRHVCLGCLPAGSAQFAGLTITEAARRSGQPAGEWLLDLLASADLNVGGHLDRPELTNADLAWVMTRHRHCAGSDGIYLGQHPHPRGFGTFARLAGQYAADGSGAGYQRLARHCAANAADAYRLHDRGRLAPGLAADICVIEPAGMTERASYDAPREPAAGVSLVIVNGAVVRRPGHHPQPAPHPGRLVT